MDGQYHYNDTIIIFTYLIDRCHFIFFVTNCCCCCCCCCCFPKNPLPKTWFQQQCTIWQSAFLFIITPLLMNSFQLYTTYVFNILQNTYVSIFCKLIVISQFICTVRTVPQSQNIRWATVSHDNTLWNILSLFVVVVVVGKETIPTINHYFINMIVQERMDLLKNHFI